MKTTTEKLAEQLREALDTIHSISGCAEYEAHRLCRETDTDAMREALAEYDAPGAPEHPDTDAFIAAAAAGHDADYYQITDDPIDRVDDGAWITIRAFVSNEDAGFSGGEK